MQRTLQDERQLALMMIASSHNLDAYNGPQWNTLSSCLSLPTTFGVAQVRQHCCAINNVSDCLDNKYFQPAPD